MLSSDLLRIKISRGKVMPLFCPSDFGNGTPYELANKMIVVFTNAQKNKQRKGDLLQKINLFESEYDYKLVRGLLSLLERRSIFSQLESSTTIATPSSVRQKLFEESSKQGLALSDSQRRSIVQTIADKMHISPDDVETVMWGDKDENLLLTRFDSIGPKDLILWYNLSLLQTLLFRCTRLEFYVKGGLHWKHVLRNVKKYGLMYNLEYCSDDEDGEDSIKCILEGPLSLFKMTDRYGASMAKLLPSIVGTPTWKIGGSIAKNTDNGKKIYSFEMSNDSTQGFIRSRIESVPKSDNNVIDDGHVYDSTVEAEFAKKFYQHFDQGDEFGWKMSREPDPLIADGKAMIPDFLFERFGRKVYFEIVGFWTKEYLERKAAKLKVLFDGNDKNKNKNCIDLLVAVNSELSCSQIETISKDKIFTFKKNVSIKPILEHLKKIDEKIVAEKIADTKIVLDDDNLDLVSVKQVAQKHAIPEDATLKIIDASYPDRYVELGSYMISKEKITAVGDSVAGISKFVEACAVFTSNHIPDSCHADLLSKMGYDVVWNDLDPNNATISKK
jgi:predicted nuclease of restriction endonuclease-like RecB superfamily